MWRMGRDLEEWWGGWVEGEALGLGLGLEERVGGGREEGIVAVRWR